MLWICPTQMFVSQTFYELGIKPANMKRSKCWKTCEKLISVKRSLENLRQALICVCVGVCLCMCVFDLSSYRAGSKSQYVADPLVHKPLRVLQATKPLHKSACLCVCAKHACVRKSVHALLSHLLQVPLWVGFSLDATRSFCHALCAVPLHIFIYYCVFQDQNEWQMGSGEIEIAAEVGVSWGHEDGRCVWTEELLRIKVDFVAACQRIHRSSSERGLRAREANGNRECYGIH